LNADISIQEIETFLFAMTADVNCILF